MVAKKIPITLYYDPSTDNIETRTGVYLWNFIDLTTTYPEVLDSAVITTVETLVKLKNAGFTAEEIVTLRNKEII